MFHLNLNFKINEKILFKSNILLHLYNIHIKVVCIHIFLLRNAISNASSYRNGRIIFIVERMICYFEYSKFAKRKTNLEGTNIPSGDKISSYIQVFLNSQWTTRNSFRNASWHAHWATFQTISILFLKLRVFLFLSNVIKLIRLVLYISTKAFPQISISFIIEIISLISCISKNC